MTGYTVHPPNAARPRTHEWMSSGLCRGEDPDLFSDERRATEAKRVCDRCPALFDCRAWACTIESGLAEDSREGVIGGLDPHQRYLLDPVAVARRRDAEARTAARTAAKPPRPKKTPPPAHCGTNQGWRRHKAMGEPVDDACNLAHRQASKEQRIARQDKAIRPLWENGATDQEIRVALGYSIALIRRVRGRNGWIENTLGRRR
ncbi:WhiB family transcriptional regulator [Streptomyces sp. C10-9-1]|uniref:WhiB family transcriptional regulator n=1 Tax=Streptomyces sp. C10-9-1 TaxID=1859285 RepID=UPI003F49ED2A